MPEAAADCLLGRMWWTAEGRLGAEVGKVGKATLGGPLRDPPVYSRRMPHPFPALVRAVRGPHWEEAGKARTLDSRLHEASSPSPSADPSPGKALSSIGLTTPGGLDVPSAKSSTALGWVMTSL